MAARDHSFRIVSWPDCDVISDDEHELRCCELAY